MNVAYPRDNRCRTIYLIRRRPLSLLTLTTTTPEQLGPTYKGTVALLWADSAGL